MISHGNQKSEQNKKKEVENIVASQDEEITNLKNHSQHLITQIKTLKGEKISHKQLKFLQKFQKQLECRITIQITRFVTIDDKIKRKNMSIIPTKRKHKIDNS